MAEDKSLSEESRKALLDVFATFDTSGNGILEKAELPAALRLAGLIASDQQIDEIVTLFDKNKDGRLQISELVDNWETLVEHSIGGDELLAAFKLFDRNGDGLIRIAELKFVLTGCGEKWTQEEAEKFTKDMLKYDTNGDGKFDYPEFVSMMRSETSPLRRPEVTGTKEGITQTYKMETPK